MQRGTARPAGCPSPRAWPDPVCCPVLLRADPGMMAASTHADREVGRATHLLRDVGSGGVDVVACGEGDDAVAPAGRLVGVLEVVVRMPQDVIARIAGDRVRHAHVLRHRHCRCAWRQAGELCEQPARGRARWWWACCLCCLSGDHVLDPTSRADQRKAHKLYLSFSTAAAGP